MSEEKIKGWLHKFGYDGEFKINENGEVDVPYADLFLNGFQISEIPVKFGKVRNFWCNGSLLTTLENSPREVDGTFYVVDNKLTSLEYSPVKVKNSFLISKNPIVKNLDGGDFESFTHWDKLDWDNIILQNPRLINLGIKYLSNDRVFLDYLISICPLTKLYLE